MSKKKNTIIFFSFSTFFVTVYSLLTFFFFSFTYSHSRGSSRLQQSSHIGSSLFHSTPNGRMAFLFYFFNLFLFSSFHTFISNHNKCKSLTLTLLQPKSLSSALIGRLALMHQLSNFSLACPARPSQPTSITHAYFCT